MELRGYELVLLSLFAVIFNHVRKMYSCTENSLKSKSDQMSFRELQPADYSAGALEFTS